MPRRYDWIFFDAGETLFRVAEIDLGYAEILAERGYTVPADRMAAIFQRARWDALYPDHLGPAPDYAIARDRAEARRERLVRALLRGLAVGPADVEACGHLIRESFVGTRLFALYPEVPGVLELLRARGYRLGIISNWEPRLVRLCQSHGIGEAFDFVLASEAEGYAKPGPYLFRRALDLAGVGADRAVHIGDSFDQDVLGARGVGIDAVLLDRGGFVEDEWQPTIGSLAELPELLCVQPRSAARCLTC